MKIDILLFGVTKDILGGNTYEIEVEKDTTVADLRKMLIIDYPALEKLRSMLVAVNSEYAEDELELNEHDEIALIPPVSGG